MDKNFYNSSINQSSLAGVGSPGANWGRSTMYTTNTNLSGINFESSGVSAKRKPLTTSFPNINLGEYECGKNILGINKGTRFKLNLRIGYTLRVGNNDHVSHNSEIRMRLQSVLGVPLITLPWEGIKESFISLVWDREIFVDLLEGLDYDTKESRKISLFLTSLMSKGEIEEVVMYIHDIILLNKQVEYYRSF